MVLTVNDSYTKSQLGMADTPRLVVIEWLDSRQPSPAWQFIESIEAPTACNCLSVGFLVYESDGVKVLASNLADTDSDDMQASGTITIPNCSIKRVTDISQPLAELA